MSGFDDCTLAEIELMTKTCLDGKTMASENVDPMILAGGIMWILARREQPEFAWDDFKNNTRMSDIKAFSIQMEADELDPTKSLSVPQT